LRFVRALDNLWIDRQRLLQITKEIIMKSSQLVAAALFVSLVSWSSADLSFTLLVNFGSHNPDHQVCVAASASDFQRGDPFASSLAAVNFCDERGMRAGNEPLSSVGIDGLRLECRNRRAYWAWNAVPGTPVYAVPIRDSYVTVSAGEPLFEQEVIISQLHDIPPGQQVVVTVWGGGDRVGQDAQFKLVYDGQESHKQVIEFGQGSPTASFSFRKVAGVNYVSILWGNANPNDFGGFAGFSLTSGESDPEELG
jgi:hypothetical protein